MTTYEIDEDQGRQSNQAATIELTDGELIDVEHHIIPDDNEIVHVYLDARSDSIDATIPLSIVRTIVQSDPARREIVCANDGTVDDGSANRVTNGVRLDEDYRRAQSLRDNYITDNGFAFGPEDNLLNQDVVGIIRRLDTLKEEIDTAYYSVIEQNSKQEYVRLARKLDAYGDGSNDEQTL